MNEVQLIGNVGNEPSFSETKDEVYAKFKMATDFTYTTSQKVKVKRKNCSVRQWMITKARNLSQRQIILL